MRLIVACDECNRQFDASKQPIGRRFRCVCSAVVTVEAPASHDSSVVRCSSCGAGRQGKSHDCSHCGDDFTLHERDLHTVCPGCLTRISDKAKFCHHCGQAMAVDSAIGADTQLDCPGCGDQCQLHSRSFGRDLSLLECGRCAGMWLGNDTFEHVVTQAESASITVEGHGSPGRGTLAQGTRQSGPAYRPCVQCGSLMQRKNYGKRSNVIIDVCKEHGVWFDAHELGAILAWVRSGGLEVARNVEKEKMRDEQRRLGSQARAASKTGSLPFASEHNYRSEPVDLVRGFLRLFLGR